MIIKDRLMRHMKIMLFAVVAIFMGMILVPQTCVSQGSPSVDYAWLARELRALGSDPTPLQVKNFLSTLEASSGGKPAISVLKDFKTATEKSSTGKEKWMEFSSSEQGVMSVIRDTLLASVAENLKIRAKKGLLGSAVAVGYSGKWTIKTKQELTFDSDFDATLFAEIMGDSNPFKSENILAEINRDVSRKLGVSKAENLSIVLTGSGFEAVADVYVSSGGKKWAVRESMNKLYMIEANGSIRDISHVPETLFATMHERLLVRYYPQLADAQTGKLRKGLSPTEIQRVIETTGEKIPGTYKIFKEGARFNRQDAATASLDMIFHTSEVADATTPQEAFAKIAKQAARSSEVFIEGMRTAPIWNNDRLLTAEDRALMRALADYEKGKIKLSAHKRSFAVARSKLPDDPELWTKGQAEQLQGILNEIEAAAVEFRAKAAPIESMMDPNDKSQTKFREKMVELMKKQAVAAHFYHIQEIINAPSEQRAKVLLDFYRELKNISDHYGEKGMKGEVMDWVNRSILEVEIMHELASKHPKAYEALIKLLKSRPEARQRVIDLLKETDMGKSVLERTGKMLEAAERTPLLGEPEPGVWNSLSNFIWEYTDAHSWRTQGPKFIIAWAGDLAMAASMVDLAMNAKDNKEVAAGVVHSIITFWPPAMIVGAFGNAYAMPQGIEKLKAYEKALLMLFVPEIMLPDMVGAIGTTIANIAATLSFDNQLDALYFLSTPDGFNEDGKLIKIGDSPQWSADVVKQEFPAKMPPFPKMNIDVDEDPQSNNMNDFYYWLFVQEGGSKELQDMIARAAIKAKGYIGEAAGGINVFMKHTVRRVVRETVVNGNVGIFKEDGPLNNAAANIRKYDQAIADFASAFSFKLPDEGKWAERVGVKPGDFGSFENITVPEWASNLDKSQVRALAHMYWNREKWRIKTKEAFLDAVVRTLEIRERAEREIRDKKYKPLLEELQKHFEDLQILDAGSAAFETAAGYNILAKAWKAAFGADLTHDRQLKMQKTLDAFIDAYRSVVKIRKAIEDTAISHTGEALSPRPLTGEVPLLSEPSLDLTMAGEFARGFQEMSNIRGNLEFIKKGRLEGEFDATVYRNIYRCEYASLYFQQVKESAQYLQKNKVYAWEYFAKRDINDIISNADAQLSNARKTCPELWQKFRDMYGYDMDFQIDVKVPKEVQKGQEFDATVSIKARPKAKEGEEPKPMGGVPDAVVKQLRYSWVIDGKVVPQWVTPFIKIKADKVGEHTLAVIVSMADLRQTPERLVEVGKKETRVIVIDVWKPTVVLKVPETGTTGTAINMVADVIADKTQMPLLSLEWFVNGGLVQKGSATTASFVPKDVGKHTVEVKVSLQTSGTEFEVARDKKTIDVTSLWKPAINISGDSQGETDKTVTLKADIKADTTARKAARVEWVLENTGKVVGTGENFSFVPGQPGTYSLKAILYVVTGGTEFPVATDIRRVTVSDSKKDKDKDKEKVVKEKDGKTDITKQPPTCSYEYSEWGECSRSTKKQTRMVIASKPFGCVEKQKPVLEQNCTPPPSEEEKRNSYLNCLCRSCYRGGWAGHIGVWYDPEGKSIPETPSSGPCFGGAGAFGNTRRHHFGAPNDCAKGCWEGAYGKGTYDPASADKIRREENKKHSKPLAVKIKASKNPADFGDIINLTAETSEGTGGYTWSWGGCAEDPKDNTAKVVNTRKCTTCAASVTVTDQDGNTASDSLTIKCNAMQVKLTKENPKENRLPIGSKATFLAEVLSGDKPASGTFYYLWEHNPDATFGDDPKNPKFETQGGAQSRNTATFGKMGTIPVWVTVLKEIDGRKTTIGESEQIPIVVTTPKLSLKADKDTPLIGETVKLTVKEEPAMNDDIISFWWEIKGDATSPGPVPNVQNNRAYSFKPKNDKPVTVTVHGKAKVGGYDLGSADAKITPKSYQVSISEPRYLESPPEIWQCDTQLGRAQSCGMVKLKPNQFTVHRDIFMKANITPQPESPRYKWTIDPSGSCGLPGIGSEIKLNCGKTGTYTVKVQVSNADGAGLGEASQSVTISVSAEQISGSKKSKEAYEKVQNAKDLVSKGKLDEGMSLVDEAVRLDDKNTEAKTLAGKWKKEKDLIATNIAKLKKYINEKKFADAEKELTEPRKIHPKYQPVVDAEKQLKDALDIQKKEMSARLAAAKDMVSKGKLDEGIISVESVIREDAQNVEAKRLFEQWKNEKKTVEVRLAKIKGYVDAGRITDAEKEFAEVVKLHPKYPPVIEAEKTLKQGKEKKANKDASDKLWNEGVALYNQKKVTEAIVKFKESVKYQSTPERVKYIQDLEIGVAKEKANKDASDKLWNEGVALYNQKKVTEAIAKFKESLKYNPAADRTSYVRDLETKADMLKMQCKQLNDEGARLQSAGMLKEALVKFTEHQRLCPSPQMENHIRQIQAKAKEMDESKAKKAHAKILRDQAYALQQQNRLKEAIAKYKESLAYFQDPELERYVRQVEMKASAQASASTPPSQAPSVQTPNGRAYTSRPTTPSAQKPMIIFDNGNLALVFNNPSCIPSFTINVPHRITLIRNYHWNNGKGSPIGTIGLKRHDGTVYGPWRISMSSGQGGAKNVYWIVNPNVVIPAGTYTIMDSDHATWSHNLQSKSCGFSYVEGVYN